DNADMRDYVARLLSMHDVVAVCDGAQALAQAKQRAPDLVLTDVMMPNLDGFALLKALREHPGTASVPVIMLSARAGEEASVEGRSAGADDYLAKPFSARELQARVEAQLTLRRVRNEALERERVLRAEAETLNAVAEQLAGELDLQALVQKVTDAATALTGAKYGAFFYNVVDDKGEAYQLYTLSGAPRSAFEKFEMPRNTPIFAPTFSGGAPVRLNDVKKDRRYGALSPHHGQPEGHLPVTSYLAVPVKTRAGEVLGGLFFGHPEPAVFTERSERLAVGVAALAAVAMDNARLYRVARDSDRRKDEFLATLAHELRNPLAPLRNGVEILQRLPLEREALEPVCRMMERQLDHIVRLIDDLLDLSRISRGKVTLQKTPVEITKAVQSAVEASRPVLEARNHRLSMSLPPESVWIDADATRLAQVFANLLNNAAKFTSPGGLIELAIEPHAKAVEVSVKDNGIGIPPAMLERIFDMFAQLEDPMQKTQAGLGIGLTLVRQLVELHGGSVRAESEGLGRGATFRVVLPTLARTPVAAATASKRPHAGSPLRVLIADDNVDAASTLGEMLAFDGHEVRVVHTGTAAVREAAEFQPQLVLLDLGMPNMDGFEACRRIRAQRPRGSCMLIAALTGWGHDEHQARAREAGFDRHLVKPAEPAQVLALLADASHARVRTPVDLLERTPGRGRRAH
ncbi:MAG TPA: response regulator, partial [Burkholderiaceae bacterium]|nr:response regulator [Burkholderiaceae bacterium]